MRRRCPSGVVLLRGSHPGIGQSGELGGNHDPLAPLGIEGGGRLRSDRVLKGAALPFERRDFLANGDEHAAVALEFRSVAGQATVPGTIKGAFVAPASIASVARIVTSMLPPVEQSMNG